jgi:hypothetical protein
MSATFSPYAADVQMRRTTKIERLASSGNEVSHEGGVDGPTA